MGLGGLPLAPKAWLRGHELQMGAIAVAARLAERQGVDMPNNGIVDGWRLGLSAEVRLESSPRSRSRRAAEAPGASACLGGVHGLRLLAKAPRVGAPAAPLPLGLLRSVAFPVPCRAFIWLAGQIRRIEVVLSGNSDQTEQGIAPGVGQRRAHPARRCHF
jgi:hypothetical protein